MCFLQVAAVSGDARRALELCRRAAEITEQRIHVSSICPASTDSSQTIATPSTDLLRAPLDPLPAVNKLIGMADIEAAITEMYQAPHIQVLPIPNEYECAVPIKDFTVQIIVLVAWRQSAPDFNMLCFFAVHEEMCEISKNLSCVNGY